MQVYTMKDVTKCGCCVVPIPADVGRHEDDADPHDDEERLESLVVTQRLDGQSLHPPELVVQLPASLALQVRMVNSAECF